LYDKWLNDTDAERLKEYSRHKEKEVTQIRRVKQGDDKEYLIYSYIQYRLDKALNVTHRWRPLVGKYPIPQAEFYVQRTDFGKEERKFKDIVSIEDGYSIPYSKENADKIKNIGLRSDGKVQYMVENPSHIRVSVATYDDFRNGVFEELVHFGRIPTEAQRKAWIEKEGGVEGDKQRHEEYKRQIDERDIPQKIPTVREVQSMIKEEISKEEKGRPRKK
jgi:hypothetical protein